jgi:hypothetical protein
MKKNTTLIIAVKMFLFLSTLINAGLSAQITITNNDMPSVGDSVRLSNSLLLPGIDYTETGEDFFWDFSGLMPLTQSVDTFVSVTSVPFLYQIIFIPNLVANLAQPITETDLFPGAPITDAYRFFRKSSSSYNDVGFAFTVNEIPVPLKFDDPDILYNFPLDYGQADSSFSGVEFGIPDLGYINIDRKRVNIADGWGTLSTSYGTFDVLRLKSHVIETDSIYIDSLEFGTAINRDYTEYKWLANGFKAPLLQVIAEGPVVTVFWIDSIFDPTVNIPEITSDRNLDVFPNPFTENARINFHNEKSQPVQIAVFDITGKKVHSVFSGNLTYGNHTFEIQTQKTNLGKGFYLLKVDTERGTITKKLLIQ